MAKKPTYEELEQRVKELENEAFEHKQTEKALRESDERYTALFDRSLDCVYIHDFEGNFIDANPATLKLFGYTKKEILSLNFASFLSQDQMSLALQILEKIKKTGFQKDVAEFKVRKKNGEQIHIEVKSSLLYHEGEPYAIQGIGRDISNRKRSEEALRESEEKYRTILESIEDGYFEVDIAGNYTFFNDSLCEILGYSKNELMGMNNRQYTDEENAKKVYQTFNKVYTTGKPEKGFDWEIIRKDRSKGYVEASVSSRKDSEGQPIGFRGIVRDVSERRQAEEEKARLEAQLQRAQKMEAIGTLAGGIAHDFNNILMAIIGHADLAKMKLAEDSEAIDNLNQVKNAGTRARRLIQQILAFSRMGEQERIALSITPLIKEALKFLKSALPTSIEIRDYIEADPGIIEADATQIHQIVMNLCTNADHAMREEGGTLDVKLIRVEVDRQTALQHHELHDGPHVRLTVTDTGCGMDSETLELIFDPYFTTKEVGEGTGLGLSVVHGIVKTHNGVITVESEPGKGTTFHVYFPVVEKEEKIQEEDEGPLPTGNERILFVDDEQVIVYIAEEMLKQLGYDVVTKKSSLEALNLFQADPNRFDLVITDMTMPKMTGDQLARELMKVRPDIPIILCTGFSPKISGKQAKEIGIKAFAMKPLVRRDMANIVRKALGD